MCLIPLASSLLSSRCSTLILQPCGTPDPLLLQPQVLGKKWDPELWEEIEPGEGKIGDSEVTRGWESTWRVGRMGVPSLFLSFSFAGPRSFSPGLDLCPLRAAAAAGGS